MKLKTKITLSVIVLLAFTFGIGGSTLIFISFNEALDSEKENALQTYKMVQKTLSITNNIDTQKNYDNIRNVIAQLDDEGKSVFNEIYLFDNNDVIYRSKGLHKLSDKIPDSCDNGHCYMEIVHEDNEHYLKIYGIIKLNYQDACLVCYYSITPIYTTRQNQISIYENVLIAVTLIGAIALWIIVTILTRPLRILSKASRELADGNLSSRANIKSHDEIRSLAEDFNYMAISLENKINELEDTLKNQEEFIGSFAHELKTPMTSIIGYADLLRRNDLDSDEEQEAIGYIFSEGKRLESLSFKLLDLLVIKNQKNVFVPVSPKKLINDIVNIYMNVIKKTGINISCDCDDGVCLAEPDLMKSLIINLTDNAIKALDGNGNIKISSAITEHGCKICVQDDGRGIPNDKIDKILQAFYRVDKARSRSQGGAGLGLALCNEIVKLHNGTISFESEEGNGTTVTVELNGGVCDNAFEDN